MNNMNMHMQANSVVGPGPNVGMLMPTGPIMQQVSPQQIQPGPPIVQPPPQDKMDNISKVKTLMSALRESIPLTLKSSAQILHQNHNIDSNLQKSAELVPRYDKNFEEFFSLCDQMELHLRTAAACVQQSQSATHYLPLTVIPSRLDSASSQENTLSYPQYLKTVKLQISYAKDIHDTLVAAAQNISPTE